MQSHFNFQVALSLSDDDSTRSKWDHGFKFVYRITLKARALVLDVDIANTGDTDWDFTLALHTYFKVPDATRSNTRIKYVLCRFNA